MEFDISQSVPDEKLKTNGSGGGFDVENSVPTRDIKTYSIVDKSLDAVSNAALELATPEEWDTRKAQIVHEVSQIPQGLKSLASILSSNIVPGFTEDGIISRRLQAADDRKNLSEVATTVGNITNELMWKPMTGWYQSMLKEVVHRELKTEDYASGKQGFQSLPRAMTRGLLGIEDVKGRDILEAAGIPKTEDIAIKHPTLAMAKEIWGSGLDVMPLPILQPLKAVSHLLEQGKYAAAEDLAIHASEKIAKARYEQMGNPIDDMKWEDLPQETKNVAVKYAGETPINDLGGKSIADIFYSHPYRSMFEKIKQSLSNTSCNLRLEKLPQQTTPPLDPNAPIEPPTVRGGLTPPECEFGNWKDKKAFTLARETAERNIEKVAGCDADKVKTFVTEPIKANETKRVDFVTKTRDEIKAKMKSLGIRAGSKADKLIQRYGEGNISLNDLKAESDKWEQIADASEYFRNLYDAFLDRINKEREKFGYTPIPKRKDYFRHYQEIGTAIRITGVLLRSNDIPTEISGLTSLFKPGKPFSNTELKRLGGNFTESAIGGMDNYLDDASKQMFHIDSVQRVRAIEKYIRIAGEEGKAKLPNFVANLNEYGNLLAGKKGSFDRATESIAGREAYSVVSWVKQRTVANMISGNMASAVTNFIPFTQSISTMDKDCAFRGMFASSITPLENNIFTIDGVRSDFIARRYPTTSISQPAIVKAGEMASSIFLMIDKFTVKSILAGKYYEGIKNGLSPEEAMKKADDYTSRIVTDRSWGALPNLFGQRTLGILTQFQTEVNNMYSWATHDLPKEYHGDARKIISALVQFSILSYIYNEVSDKVMGRRPTIDPIYAMLALAGVTHDTKGKPFPKRAWKAMSNMLENMPFVGSITGGRLPIGAGIPDAAGVMAGKKDLGKELIRPLTYLAFPFGGGQVKKTIEGVSSYARGQEVDEKGRVKYTIKQDVANLVRGILFGARSFPEAQAYLDSIGVPKEKTGPKTTLEKMMDTSSKPKKTMLESMVK